MQNQVIVSTDKMVTTMREYGSEFDFIEKDCSIQNIWNHYSSFHILRCGRDAVLATAKILKNQYGISTVWAPALSCSSMFDGFVAMGLSVNFYPIDEKFNPLPDEKIDYSNSAILFMLYYGVTDHKIVDDFVRNHPECVSVIDISHALWNENTYKINADIFIGSIRKSVGVVNGGIFLSNKYSINVKNSSNQFTILRNRAFQRKNDYNTTLDSDIKKEYRALFAEAEASLERERDVYCADINSINTIMSINVKELQHRRISNFNTLYNLLLNGKGYKLLVNHIIAGATPFSLPVIVNNQNEIQESLAKTGVYAPILWPISDIAKQICPFSKQVAENMLSLPIDQRYTMEDMREIAERFKRTIDGKD